MESEFEEIYKKKQFLHALKTGKVPLRAGLGTRLWLLAGFNKGRVYCTVEKCDPPLTDNEDTLSFTKRLCFSKTTYLTPTIVDKLHSQQMRDTFKKYLKSYEIVNHWAYIFVYFDPKNTPSWAILDEDLKNKYPNNYVVDKRGFIQYK